MRFFLIFSLKNMFRQKGRTMLTTVPIIVGTILLIYMMSFVDGLNEISINNIINYQTAHAKIFHKDYDFEKKGNNDNATFIPDTKLLNYLKSHNKINAYTNQIFFSGNLSNGINKIPVFCLGIEPESYRKTFKTLNDTLIPINSPLVDEIIIGSSLKKIFDLNNGDLCFLEGRSKFGTYDALDLFLSSGVNTGNPNIDRNFIIVNIDNAKRFLDIDGEVTNIAILLKNEKQVDGFTKKVQIFLNSEYPDLKIVSWKEEEKDFFAFAYLDQVSGYIMILIVLIIAGVGIANTMLLSTYERLKEIGTMRSLGASARTIIKLYISEGAMIGILGATIGSLIGLILMWHAHHYGIDFSAFMEDMSIGYPIKNVIKGSFNMMIIAKTVFFTFIIAVISSVYPARRAIKEQISKIMK